MRKCNIITVISLVDGENIRTPHNATETHAEGSPAGVFNES